MRRRVVVTGMGCVCPLGTDVAQVWNRLLLGHSGSGPITLFDPAGFPVRIAAEVKGWDASALGGDVEVWRRHSRQTQFAAVAASAAVAAAGPHALPSDPTRTGVYLGCGEVFPDFLAFCASAGARAAAGGLDLGGCMARALRQATPELDSLLDPGAAAACLSSRFNAQGPNANFTSACVSSSKAIGEAAEVIRRGDADVMLCGGAHSMIHPFGLTGFCHLSTLSRRNDDPQGAARPFDRDRDGFVLGEGGAVLVLEELERARQRGAEILAEFSGWGATHDAYRITDLDPEGTAAARAIVQALSDACLNPEDIDYINAHGSGTTINDKAETLATKRALGSCVYHVPISSTKSMLGHLTTACGAVEAMCCVLAVRDDRVPPTINYATPDPDCDLDYVPNAAREVRCRHTMTNNFGFGGLNVSLVFSRYRG